MSTRLEPERKKLFAARLRQAAMARYEDQFGLASRISEMADVSIATAGRWLRGSVTPSPERWPELAVGLGVSVDWLTGKTHEMPSNVAENIDHHELELSKRVTRASLMAVQALKPNISDDELDSTIDYAYHLFEAGYSHNEVVGALVERLKPRG